MLNREHIHTSAPESATLSSAPIRGLRELIRAAKKGMRSVGLNPRQGIPVEQQIIDFADLVEPSHSKLSKADRLDRQQATKKFTELFKEQLPKIARAPDIAVLQLYFHFINTNEFLFRKNPSVGEFEELLQSYKRLLLLEATPALEPLLDKKLAAARKRFATLARR